MRHQVRRSERGFTMIELIIVLAILAIAAVMVVPRLFVFVDRTKLKNAAYATRTMIQQARLAGLKGTGNGCVAFDYPSGRIFAFVDSDGNGIYDNGTDRLLGDYRLNEVGKKSMITFMRNTDTGPKTSGAMEAFDDYEKCGVNGCIVFNQTGAPARSGSVSFTDGYGNFIEVAILNATTGRTELRKYHRGKNLYIPDTIHTETGSRSVGWEWYEDRDVRVTPL